MTCAEPGDGPIVLMVAPTRELAVQIQQETQKFGASSRIKHTCVYGGAPKGPQTRDLRDGAQSPGFRNVVSPRLSPRPSVQQPLFQYLSGCFV